MLKKHQNQRHIRTIHNRGERTMFKIMLDYTYLKALIFKNHPKHELAQKMAENIENTDHLYLPPYTLNHIFEDINNKRDEKTKKTI